MDRPAQPWRPSLRPACRPRLDCFRPPPGLPQFSPILAPMMRAKVSDCAPRHIPHDNGSSSLEISAAHCAYPAQPRTHACDRRCEGNALQSRHATPRRSVFRGGLPWFRRHSEASVEAPCRLVRKATVEVVKWHHYVLLYELDSATARTMPWPAAAVQRAIPFRNSGRDSCRPECPPS